MLFFFIIGLINSMFADNKDVALDHIVMIILTFTLFIKDNTIINYKKVIDSYSMLVDTYDTRNAHQREIIAMLKNTIEVKNQDINELKTKLSDGKI
jgi:hypothetical protein